MLYTYIIIAVVILFLGSIADSYWNLGYLYADNSDWFLWALFCACWPVIFALFVVAILVLSVRTAFVKAGQAVANMLKSIKS